MIFDILVLYFWYMLKYDFEIKNFEKFYLKIFIQWVPSLQFFLWENKETRGRLWWRTHEFEYIFLYSNICLFFSCGTASRIRVFAQAQYSRMFVLDFACGSWRLAQPLRSPQAFVIPIGPTLVFRLQNQHGLKHVTSLTHHVTAARHSSLLFSPSQNRGF